MPRRPDLPCADCGKLMWRGPGVLPEGQARCQSCRRANPRRKSREYRIGAETACPTCGVVFRPMRSNGGWTVYCSKPCSQVGRAGSEFDQSFRDAAPEDKNRLGCAKRRSIRRAAFVEKVDRLVVFERDNWICHICGEPVDKNLSGRVQMGPTIDHIVPYGKGGLDCYDNVALAHRACNSRKWVSTDFKGAL